jgi:hypothetical protein
VWNTGRISITVPSCSTHNTATSKDDEYAVVIVAAQFENAAVATAHYADKISRALKNWDHWGPEERKVFLDYWVYDVLIVVEPVPGMKRANRKTAVVTLRTAPGAPKHFELDGSEVEQHTSRQTSRRARAERRAASTRGSLSSRAHNSSGSTTASAPICPSAQAACARTSGSTSDKAAVSDGNADGSPALPSTTAALRFNPRSLARFIGDPRNASENSDGDMAKNSRARVGASLPAIAGRAAKAGSDSGRENLWVYGHTSWQISQP